MMKMGGSALAPLSHHSHPPRQELQGVRAILLMPGEAGRTLEACLRQQTQASSSAWVKESQLELRNFETPSGQTELMGPALTWVRPRAELWDQSPAVFPSAKHQTKPP